MHEPFLESLVESESGTVIKENFKDFDQTWVIYGHGKCNIVRFNPRLITPVFSPGQSLIIWDMIKTFKLQ